jgi:uncharacterized protein YndB with AHSA1/START domain
MTQCIKHTFFFPHPPEAVWEYLTRPEMLAQWLMENNFQATVGADFQFKTKPIANLDFDGIFYCRVLEIVPLEKLSYSWNCGPGEGRINLNSVIVWKLQPTDNGTELLLEHSGFEKSENMDFYHGLTKGWLEKFDKVAKLLNAAPYGNTIAPAGGRC